MENLQDSVIITQDPLNLDYNKTMETSQDTSSSINQNISDSDLIKLKKIRVIISAIFIGVLIIGNIFINSIGEYAHSFIFAITIFSGILFLRNENKLFVANFISTGNKLKNTPGVKYGGFLFLIIFILYVSLFLFMKSDLWDFTRSFFSFNFYKLALLMFYYLFNGTQDTFYLSIGTQKFFLKNEIPGRILIRILIIIPFLIYGYLAYVLSHLHG